MTSAVSGKTSYLVAYDHSTKKYREAAERRRDGKPGPQICDEAAVDAVLARAAATRKAAEAKHAAPSQAGPSDEPSQAGPSDEPGAKRQCV